MCARKKRRRGCLCGLAIVGSYKRREEYDHTGDGTGELLRSPCGSVCTYIVAGVCVWGGGAVF